MNWPITSTGRVNTILNNGAVLAGSSFLAGIAISAPGKLQLSTAAVASTDVFSNGLRMKPNGVLRVATSGAVGSAPGGLPVTSNGQLVVTTSGAPSVWVGGIPISADGKVCVTAVT